jgi:hypothetical protein
VATAAASSDPARAVIAGSQAVAAKATAQRRGRGTQPPGGFSGGTAPAHLATEEMENKAALVFVPVWRDLTDTFIRSALLLLPADATQGRRVMCALGQVFGKTGRRALELQRGTRNPGARVALPAACIGR